MSAKRPPGRPPLSEDEPTVRIFARVPQSLRDRAHAVAEQEGRSLGALVRDVLERSLRQREARIETGES